MALLDVRKKFVETSGRYDLVGPNFEDAGADWFIRQAQRWLDRSFDAEQHIARLFRRLSPGQTYLTFRNARVLKRLFVYDSEKARIPLMRLTAEQVYEVFGKAATAVEPSMPRYWAPGDHRMPERERAEDIQVASEFVHVIAGNTESINSITFLPPADREYAIELWGAFYSPDLTENTSKSYWTEQHESLLVLTSLMQLEKFYRNSDGVRDAMAGVMDEVAQLDMDRVAQQIIDIDQMEG